MPSRRTVLKVGAAGAVLLALAGLGADLLATDDGPQPSGPALTNVPDDAAIALAAIAPVMLGGVPAGLTATDFSRTVLTGIDTALAGLTPAQRNEAAQLFSLLRLRPARRWLLGLRAPWHAATAAEISATLDRLRHSRLQVLRAVYQGLHQLIGAAWYGNPAAWPAIGYGGPPAPVLAALGRSA